MNPRTGLILRLLGPLIEVGCLILLKQYGGRERSVLGLPVDSVLYAGLGLGLLMVLAGLALSMIPKPARSTREDFR